MGRMKSFLLACAVLSGVFSWALTVSEIASFRREDVSAEPSFVVTGVVACAFDWQQNSFALVDRNDPDGRGIFVCGHLEGRPDAAWIGGNQVEPGDVVRVTGNILPFMLEPGIYASEIRILDQVELPPPREYRLSELAHGLYNNRRVNVSGILRQVRTDGVAQHAVTILTLGTIDGLVIVRVRGSWPELARFRDAELSVDGVCVPSFNSRAEFLHPEIEALSRSTIRVIPSGQPIRAVARDTGRRMGVLAWMPDGYDGHLRKLSGEVLYVSAKNRYFILQGDLGVRVTVEGDDLPSVGDFVEADGFPTMSDDCGVLDSGCFRVIGHAESPVEPETLSEDFIDGLISRGGPGEYDAHYRYVRVKGRVMSCEETSDGKVEIALAVGSRRMIAVLEAPDAFSAGTLTDRPLVELTGILKVNFEGDRIGGRGLVIRDFGLLLRSGNDIRRLGDFASASRRVGRLATQCGLLMLVPLVMLAFYQWLRNVRQRERSRAVSEDRRRLAEELHDTIAQHISGARLLLFSVQADASSLSSASRDALTMAGDILEAARREMRDKILNLQSDDLMLRPLSELLRGVVRKTNAFRQVRVRMHLRGLPSDMPVQMKTDLLATIQEAISNAVKHGRAKNVVIVSDPLGTNGYVLSVLNDGERFDFRLALGTETGHFGLSSMRERANRNGFKLSFGEREGWTEVRLERTER